MALITSLCLPYIPIAIKLLHFMPYGGVLEEQVNQSSSSYELKTPPDDVTWSSFSAKAEKYCNFIVWKEEASLVLLAKLEP